MRGLGISEPPCPPLTMRSGYDWVDVAEEKEPAYEGVECIWLRVWKLLVHQRPSGLAEPPDAKGDLVYRVLQKLQDLQHKVFQQWDMLRNQLLHFRVTLSLSK